MDIFFQTVAETIQTLAYWQFWLVTVGSALTIFVATLPVMLLMSSDRTGTVGCLTMPLIWVAAPIILTIGIILVTPLMISRQETIAWGLVDVMWWDRILVVAGVGYLALIIVSIIPVIGQIEVLPLYAQSSVVIASTVNYATGGEINLWPSPLMILALVALSLIASMAIFYVLTLLIALVSGANKAVMELISLPLGTVSAFVPAAVYSGWLRAEYFA